MTLTEVPTELLPAAWPLVEEWIAAACAVTPGDYSADDLRGLCEREEGRLILIGAAGEAPVAAGVTQIRDHEDGARDCWILAVGGDQVRAWRDTLPIIEDGARRIGCASVRFVGRPGWAGLLRDYDCDVSYRKML